jgi:hypothetical protein
MCGCEIKSLLVKQQINKQPCTEDSSDAFCASHVDRAPLLLEVAVRERRTKRASWIGGCCTGKDRVWRSPGHCTRLFGSRFQASLLYKSLVPFGFLSLCAVYPATLRLVASLRSSSFSNLAVPVALASDLSSVLLIVREPRRYVAIFCRFYFREHLVAGMRTKGTCSPRKSQEARGWLAHAVRSIYLRLAT